MDENEKKLHDESKDNFDIDSELNDFLSESFEASKALDSIVGEDKSENVVASADETLTNLTIRKNLVEMANNGTIHKEKNAELKNIIQKISKESIVPTTDEDFSLNVEEAMKGKKDLSKEVSDILDEIKGTESEHPLTDSIFNEPVENKPIAPKEKFNLNIDYSKTDTPKTKSNYKAQVSKPKEQTKTSKKKKKVEVNHSIFIGLIVTVVVLVVSVSLAFFGISLGLEYLGINKSDTLIKLNIAEGSSTDEIAQQLIDADIIDNKFLFKVIVNLKKAGSLMKPGDIELKPSWSYADKIDALMVQRESFETVSVVFPEGTTLLEAAKILEDKGVISDYQELIYTFNSEKFGYDYENLIDSKGKKFYAMEGYFYPDTYNFYIDDSCHNVVKTVREHFNSKFTEAMRTTMRKNGMNMDQVIILASIVQAEAGSAKDMPKVASVFLNRLNDRANFPRLESDATDSYYNNVIKVEAENSKSYTESEIQAFKDIYDTYIANGLPAGPICNPGLEAINAVLYPEKTDYLYFCSNLKTKKTYFAKTLSKHKKNLVKAGLDG